MKRNIKILVILLGCTEIALANEQQSTRGPIVTPAFQNPIHPEDLSTSANPQYTVKSSGRYYFTNHISRNHNTAAGVVILINASNVTLDLNAKSLVPTVSGSLATGTGIAVARGRSNIQVMNGFIYSHDSSGTQKLNTGIDLSETSLSSGSGTSYSIKLQDLDITRCKLNGISGTAINDLTIQNCSANNGSGASTVNGITLTTVNNLIIKNCNFTKNISSGGNCSALKLTDCIDGLIENCDLGETQTTGDSIDPIGIYLEYSSLGCRNLTFKKINTSGSVASGSTGGTAKGLFVADSNGASRNLRFEDCLFNNITSTGNVRNIDLVDCAECKFYRCQANGGSSSSSGSDVHAVALGDNVANCYLEDVTANGNYNAANSGIKGFRIACTNTTLVRCIANNNYSTNTGASSSVYVYGFSVEANDNTFIECQANGNMTQAAAAVTCAGFYSSASTNNRFEKCIANRNRSTSTSSAVVAAGFILAGAETRSQIIGCEASHNLVGDATSSNGSARAYGIYFNGSSPAVNCSVKNCNLHYNTVGSSGSGKAFGFYDNSASPSTSLLIGNIAMGQGQCLGTTLGAALQWNANSEPSASQNYFFKHAGTGDDPRQMISEVPRQNFGSISTAVVNWQNISVF